jgi:hypothetical protein
MAISAGDIYRTTIHWEMAGQRCVNVLHFRAQQAAATSLSWNPMLDQLMARVVNIAIGLGQIAHESVMYDRIETVAIHAGAGAHARTHDLNMTGNRSGELLPGFVALPIYLQTALAGRSRRGRLHAGGWTEADQDAGVLTSAALTAAGTLRDVIVNNMTTTTGGWQGIIYSRKIAQEAGIGPFDITPQPGGESLNPTALVTGGHTGAILGSMYSRKIGRGS